MSRIKVSRVADRGGVSIFIVVFTALMVTIVTASFVQIVLRNQQIASNNDLSQSAYDSAMAGVEDAKRALVRLRECENDPSNDCELAIQAALNSPDCDALGQLGVVTFDEGEVVVGSPEQNQAYTCVKVKLNTEGISKDLEPGIPVVIPLKSSTPFNKIKIHWFTLEDLNGSSFGVSNTATPTLLKSSSGDSGEIWQSNWPPMLRAQLIQFRKNNLQLSQFESGNAHTLFLYPTSAGITQHDFGTDLRMNPITSRNSPRLVYCSEANLTDEDNGYACTAEITLPNPISGTAANREAYLQLMSIYGGTTLAVDLFNGPTKIEFNGVQPEVDSTGRASDLFRRVKARLTVTDGARDPFLPNAALSTEGNLCKTFFITDAVNEYETGECTP